MSYQARRLVIFVVGLTMGLSVASATRCSFSARSAQRSSCLAFACPSRRRSTRLALSSVQRKDNDGMDYSKSFETKYEQLMGASRLSLAPMMEYTDRHFRHVVRLISKRTLLYTEMVAANALSHERRDVMSRYRIENPNASPEQVREGYSDEYLRRYLSQGLVEPLEGPSVLQLGGSDPEQLFEAAETVIDLSNRGHCDYTAINLNCGCPSPKVAGKGCFGAALMDDPHLVADITRAIHDGTGGRLPVTVKCRIGTDSNDVPFNRAQYDAMDENEEYDKLRRFIETVAGGGVVTDFQVHARIAVLNKKFSPSDNRKIPPLKYQLVRRLVQDYSPDLTFSINGGVGSIEQVQEQLDACPGLLGVMVGRAWAADPWSFAMADRLLYNDSSEESCGLTRWQILQEYGRHADGEESMWDPVKIRRFLIKAITPLFTGETNAKRYRIALDEIAGRPKQLQQQGKSLDGEPPLSELILQAAEEHLSPAVLAATPEESHAQRCWKEKNIDSSQVA